MVKSNSSGEEKGIDPKENDTIEATSVINASDSSTLSLIGVTMVENQTVTSNDEV